jgi:D-3-phosphoglycerate dehydrogenase / 2-oxoglutarate reductase
MRKKVLLTRTVNYLPGAEEALGKAVDMIFSPGITEKEIIPLVKDVNAIVAPDTTITESIIQAAPMLQVVSTPQVGYDKINVAAATKAGVPVVANVGLTADAVAEFTVGLMISIARRIVRADHDLKEKKNWSIRGPYANPKTEMGIDFKGSIVGLVGLGAIGSTVARMCKSGFSCRILAFDPFVSQERMAAMGVEKRDSLTALAKEVDFLSLHINLINETKHLINETVLRAMKPGAFLINCARGPVVDEKALVKALQEKWITGAATDVFEEEPVNPENPLLTMPNVIVTPHIGGVTVQSSVRRGSELVKRILEVFDGKKPEGLVNPDVWPAYLKRLASIGK